MSVIHNSFLFVCLFSISETGFLCSFLGSPGTSCFRLGWPRTPLASKKKSVNHHHTTYFYSFLPSNFPSLPFPPLFKDRHYLRVKVWENIFQSNGPKKLDGVPSLQIELLTKVNQRDRGGFIFITRNFIKMKSQF